jgi:hypothetical protein
MKTKMTFFKSYYRMGWWAARVPAAGEWNGHEVDLLGFGVTQTQAERDLAAREQARMFESQTELAA